jgi:DNA processing protein
MASSTGKISASTAPENHGAACVLWFRAAEGIGRITARALLDANPDHERLFFEGPQAIQSASPDQRLALEKAYRPQTIMASLERTHRMGVKIVLPSDSNYPERLLEIEDAPLMLYAKGDLDLLQHLRPLAIVGTRHPTQYGRKVAAQLTEAAIDQDALIISGLAVGIDAIAHEGALAAKMPTVAVLGCGIDVNYPSANTDLKRRILETGLILTEQEMGVPALPAFFPDRNRIISGLSAGIVIVEAIIKSGTMSTALHGLKQGREVFAVPGNIDAPQSAGTNYLIQQMAHILTTPDDLFQRLCWGPPKKKTIQLPQAKKRVYEVIRHYGDVTIDDLIEKTGYPAGELYEILGDLEIKRLIRCWFGRYNLK